MLYGKGVIPYVISGTFTREQRLAIKIAMKEYQDKTCIRFVKKRRKHKYFVDIINNKKMLQVITHSQSLMYVSNIPANQISVHFCHVTVALIAVT